MGDLVGESSVLRLESIEGVDTLGAVDTKEITILVIGILHAYKHGLPKDRSTGVSADLADELSDSADGIGSEDLKNS